MRENVHFENPKKKIEHTKKENKVYVIRVMKREKVLENILKIILKFIFKV